MEKGEAQRMGVDRLLAQWALEEGIIEPKGDGEYRLCPNSGMGGGSANGGSTLERKDSIMSLPDSSQLDDSTIEVKTMQDMDVDT